MIISTHENGISIQLRHKGSWRSKASSLTQAPKASVGQIASSFFTSGGANTP